jgi:hypothetical protein
MAMHDPVLHRFIAYLGEKKAEQEANLDSHIRIELSREQITAVRDSFRQSILDGERLLHNLSHLLASVLLESDFELHSNVIGVLPGSEERPFLIRERIKQKTLFSVTDIDLGNQMLDNFRYRLDRAWVPLALSANFVEYLPVGRPETGVNRITSRVKAEEELWNKVTDELFLLDDLVSRDKHLRQYSKYVKDIFGIKIVCEHESTCLQVHEQLQKLTYSDLHRLNLGWLENLTLPEEYESSEPVLDFIETKNYLTCDPSEMKQTGWKALKSVVRWGGRLFEIQVQPLANYYLELDHMSGPSHGSFKIQRDNLRRELADRIPLYGFYRDLLKMLFMETDVSFECHNASVVIH